ncbi:glycosyltransferase [Bacillus salitolerans]|uniref:Glycosyltransferase n=1 Tax=Bacillus salitolerans TaxID=1437434 RepID=A0ABW4LKA8_9BACI
MTNNSILFVPTNGVGLGHLTRTLAVARRLKKVTTDRECIIFTTSPAVHLIKQEDMLGYHLPSSELFKGKITPRDWNHQMSVHLQLIINQHQPSTIVFDGAFPYAGILSGIKNKNIVKVWVRRQINKQHPNYEKLLQKEKDFKYVVVPGEIGQKQENSNINQYFHSNPVVYLDHEELLTKEQVRKYFNIPDGDKVLYIQLGAGKINDIFSPIQFILEELCTLDNTFIILGESPLGERLNIDGENMITIRDFPNSRYFNGIDLAISASGYNSVSELVYFQVPTIFIPNQSTRADDQLMRAKLAEEYGPFISLQDLNKESFHHAVKRLLFNREFFDQRNKSFTNGAEEIATFLSNI